MTKRIAGPISKTTSVFDGSVNNTVDLTDVLLAVALSTVSIPIFEVLVQNDPSSASSVVVGNATGQYIVLVAGANTTIPLSNLNMVYVLLL